MILCDRRRLGRAIGNLLSNAVNVSGEGATISLHYSLEEDSGLEIQVRDSGPWLTAEEIGIAMQPLGQIECHRARRNDGAGLGLPLAKRLCDLHGGRLTLSSVPGDGVTAAVLLPPGRVRLDG